MMTSSSKFPGGPDATKFKKGTSGNPGGRPKGAKGMKTLLAQELKASITVQQDGEKKRIRRSEAVIKRLVNDALQGRDRPRDTVLRYAEAIEQEGKQREASELSTDDQAILDRYFERRLAHLKRMERNDESD